MENSEMAPLAAVPSCEPSKLTALLNVVGAVSVIVIGVETIVRAIDQIHHSGKSLAAMRREQLKPPQ